METRLTQHPEGAPPIPAGCHVSSSSWLLSASAAQTGRNPGPWSLHPHSRHQHSVLFPGGVSPQARTHLQVLPGSLGASFSACIQEAAIFFQECSQSQAVRRVCMDTARGGRVKDAPVFSLGALRAHPQLLQGLAESHRIPVPS